MDFLLLYGSYLPVAAVIAILLLILYLKQQHEKVYVFKRQGIPGPNPWLYPFSVVRILLPNFMHVDLSRVRKYGKIYGTYDGKVASLVVADPLILKDMLVRHFSSFADKRDRVINHRIMKKFLSSINGEDWRNMRHVVSPTFTSGKMKAMFGMMSDSASLMMQTIDKSQKTEFNLRDLFGCLTMDVIAKCAFAIDADAHADEASPFVANAKAFFKPSYITLLRRVLLPESVIKLFGIREMSIHMEYLISLAEKMVAERRKQMSQGIKTNKYNDFLQLMIEAGTDDDEERDENENPSDGKNIPKKKAMTDEEIVANTVLVLIAGYETTASLLTYTVYALACNPDVQQVLRQEVRDAGQLNYETVMKLPYLDAVINESLRMFSPVLRIERMVSNKDGFTFDCDLGKIHMPFGTGVTVPIYAIHHMEEYFPQPEKFDPERFMPENKEKLVPYSMLAFSLGPRSCVGMRFALLEAKLALASLVSHYTFYPTKNTDIPLDLSRSTVLLSPKRVVVGIQKLASE